MTAGLSGEDTDDTVVWVVLGLVTNGNRSAYRKGVGELCLWSKDNNLKLNTIKTKEMVVDSALQPPQLKIDGAAVKMVLCLKYLGTSD